MIYKHLLMGFNRVLHVIHLATQPKYFGCQDIQSVFIFRKISTKVSKTLGYHLSKVVDIDLFGFCCYFFHKHCKYSKMPCSVNRICDLDFRTILTLFLFSLLLPFLDLFVIA